MIFMRYHLVMFMERLGMVGAVSCYIHELIKVTPLTFITTSPSNWPGLPISASLFFASVVPE
jgi:hypothetical protein